jgi:hypothetical protein
MRAGEQLVGQRAQLVVSSAELRQTRERAEGGRQAGEGVVVDDQPAQRGERADILRERLQRSEPSAACFL